MNLAHAHAHTHTHTTQIHTHTHTHTHIHTHTQTQTTRHIPSCYVRQSGRSFGKAVLHSNTHIYLRVIFRSSHVNHESFHAYL